MFCRRQVFICRCYNSRHVSKEMSFLELSSTANRAFKSHSKLLARYVNAGRSKQKGKHKNHQERIFHPKDVDPKQ